MRYKARTLNMQRVLNQKKLNQALAQKTSLAKLKQSTCTLKTSTENFSMAQHWENPKATAFVIEEIHEGRKQLWGVTASHYFLKDPLLEIANQEIPVNLVAQGHHGFNDVTLFPIPAQMQDKVTPLPLAKQSADLGEKLYSAGYFEDEFHVENDRVVTDKTPHKFITSLHVQENISREGACGGPVLNKQGEVVGMHVGSSQPRQAGFVVPVENIYELLNALHHDGKLARPFYFNGRKIGTLNINEHIYAIKIWKESRLLENFLTYRERYNLDYQHLEKLVDASGADTIYFIIEKAPFSTLEKDQKTHTYEIIYDLKTFHISKRAIK